MNLLLLWNFMVMAMAFSPFDSPDFCSQNITSTCNTTFHSIDEINELVRPQVKQLVNSDYFRYFKLDLDKQCKFWNAQHFCATENCAVEVLSNDQYNWTKIHDDKLRPSQLGKIINSPTDVPGPKNPSNTCEDLDYCHIDDGHHCVYVDLIANPERFTGYGGLQSLAVWQAIYSENCFPNTNPMSMTSSTPEKCVEKNLFYRLVSGMHASIAVHLSNEYLNPDTGEFYPNLGVFMERVGRFNDRLSNIYFNYALVSQALVSLQQMEPLSRFISSDESVLTVGSTNRTHHAFDLSNDEVRAAELLDEVIPVLGRQTMFDTSLLFNPATTEPDLKNEFRSRFKNISAIMDCVGCDRCRMWGKVQTIGYGTALKILFENESENLSFRRIEIVALINTFDRLSKSLEAIGNFKKMYLKHLEDVQAGKAKRGQYEEGNTFAFPFKQSDKFTKKSSESTVPAKSASKSAAKKPQLVENDPPTAWQYFKSEWNQAISDVTTAFAFVFRSYYYFPRMVWNHIVLYLSVYWQYFIGKTVYVDQTVVANV